MGHQSFQSVAEASCLCLLGGGKGSFSSFFLKSAVSVEFQILGFGFQNHFVT